MSNGNTVGIPAPRVEGAAKVSGTAAYAADINLPGQLWVKVLRSPIAHGRIKQLDIQDALKIPGVKAIITGADLAGAKIGKKIIDMPLLADGVVRYIGEKLAAVAAENEGSAEEAIARIVVEFEELEVVTDPIEAAKSSAPLIHPDVMTYKGLLHEMERPSNVFVSLNWKRGQVDEAFAQADLTVENTFTTPMVHQGYIEPHCCLVKAQGDGAEIWASSKSPFGMRDHLGMALGLRAENVVVHPGYIGGDFGGKGDANDIAVCYVLAKKTGRPVKFLMDYTEELMAGNPRHASTTTVRTGIKKNGFIVAQHISVLFDSGAYGSYRPQGYLVGAHSAGPYKIPNLLIEEKYVYTNKVPCGYMRAPGHPQVHFATESQLDIIAAQLAMDPAELRRMNFIHDGDEDTTGALVSHIRTDETLQTALETSGYFDPKPHHRGRGFAVAHWVSKGGESYVNVSIDADGVITVGAALVDVGPGAYTMMRQIVARELSVSMDAVQVETLDTTAVIKDTGVRGSSSTRVHGNASYDAVEKAKAEILQRGSESMMVPIAELAVVNGGVTHMKSERRMTFAELVTAKDSPILGQGHYANMVDGPEASMVAQVADVEVDPETGELKVLQITSAHNTGTVLNPLGHQGQIDGAVVMGMGFALTEEIRTEEGGRISTTNLGDYKLPNIKDAPVMKTVVVESRNGSGPYGSMSIGETALIPTAAAIANAVQDAVGVRIKSLPITAEKIREALRRLTADKGNLI